MYMIKNVKEFINYRTTCPLCGENLSLSFKGKNRKIIRYEGDRVLIKKDMYTLNKKRSYSFIYSINIYNNTFYIDFLNNRNEMLSNSIPISYIQGFNKYNKSNTGIFYRYCPSCSCYSYNSNHFNIDMKCSKFESFYLADEYISTYKKIGDDNYRVYRIINQYDKNTSVVDWFNADNNELNLKLKMKWNYMYYTNDNMIKINIQNIQKIDDINNLINRLEKLFIFI